MIANELVHEDDLAVYLGGKGVGLSEQLVLRVILDGTDVLGLLLRRQSFVVCNFLWTAVIVRTVSSAATAATGSAGSSKKSKTSASAGAATSASAGRKKQKTSASSKSRTAPIANDKARGKSASGSATAAEADDTIDTDEEIFVDDRDAANGDNGDEDIDIDIDEDELEQALRADVGGEVRFAGDAFDDTSDIDVKPSRAPSRPSGTNGVKRACVDTDVLDDDKQGKDQAWMKRAQKEGSRTVFPLQGRSSSGKGVKDEPIEID